MRNQGHFETNTTSFVTVFRSLDLASLQMLTIEEFVGSPRGYWEVAEPLEGRGGSYVAWDMALLGPYSFLSASHKPPGEQFLSLYTNTMSGKGQTTRCRDWTETTETVSSNHSKVDYLMDFSYQDPKMSTTFLDYFFTFFKDICFQGGFDIIREWHKLTHHLPYFLSQRHRSHAWFLLSHYHVPLLTFYQVLRFYCPIRTWIVLFLSVTIDTSSSKWM